MPNSTAPANYHEQEQLKSKHFNRTESHLEGCSGNILPSHLLPGNKSLYISSPQHHSWSKMQFFSFLWWVRWSISLKTYDLSHCLLNFILYSIPVTTHMMQNHKQWFRNKKLGSNITIPKINPHFMTYLISKSSYCQTNFPQTCWKYPKVSMWLHSSLIYSSYLLFKTQSWLKRE